MNKPMLYRVIAPGSRMAKLEWLPAWYVRQLRRERYCVRKVAPRRPRAHSILWRVEAKQFKYDSWAVIREGLSYGKAETLIRKLRPICVGARMRRCTEGT